MKVHLSKRNSLQVPSGQYPVAGRRAGIASVVKNARQRNQLTCGIYVAANRTVFAGCQDGCIVMWTLGDYTERAGWLRRHRGRVTCLHSLHNPKITGSKTLLVSGSADASIKVWDPSLHRDPEKTCVQTLVGHEGTITSLVSLGRCLITASTDSTVRIWFALENREATLYPWFEQQRVLGTFAGWVHSLSLERSKNVGDFGTLYAADSTGAISGWKVRVAEGVSRNAGLFDLEPIDRMPSSSSSSYRPSTAALYGMPTSPMKGTAAQGPAAMLLRLRATAEANRGYYIHQHVQQGQISPENSKVDSRGVSVAPPLAFRRLHDRGVLFIRAVPEECLVLTLAFDNTLRAYDSEVGTCSFSLSNSNGCAFTWLEWNPLHREILLVDKHGFFGIYGIELEGLKCNQRISKQEISHVLFRSAPDDVAVITCDGVDFYHLVREVDFSTVPNGHAGPVIALLAVDLGMLAGVEPSQRGAVERDEQVLLFSASLDNTVVQWDSTGRNRKLSFTEYRSEISAMMFLLSRKQLVTGHDDGTIRLWNMDTGSTINMKEHSNTVSCIITAQLRKGEEMVITGGFDGKVGIWDLRKRQASRPHLLTMFEAHPGTEVLTLLHDPSKGTLITGGNDRFIHVWHAGTWSKLGSHVGHREAITCLTLDANFLFSGSEDCSIRIWNTVTESYTGTFIKALQGHSKTVTALTMLTDTGQLLSCSLDGKLLIWNYSQGEIVRTFAHHEEFRCMAVRNDTREVFLGTQQNNILLYPLPDLEDDDEYNQGGLSGSDLSAGEDDKDNGGGASYRSGSNRDSDLDLGNGHPQRQGSYSSDDS
eukprot:jgi/Mesvir1/28222/Mv04771-RA.1